ncbi:hypothetical protein [uncultured Draconibacterium sp.]|uniref:hypothetical protein n=1 Tax=uncultured Draconibacterium sp. TaxID=1573823 RepID=UPI0029C690E2|nr:hypothetical protein [uncultured Draconibacterium sp.]
MKKLFIFFFAVVLTAISANTFAQGTQQTVLINASRNYWVNSTDGTTQDVSGHTNSTYVWSIYEWDGLDATDYTSSGWTATPSATTEADFVFGNTSFNTQIEWLAAGSYVVEVVETSDGDGCTTKRRFGVKVLELDLLTTTTYVTQQVAPLTTCNTNSGDIWGDSNDDNLNAEALATMTITYEITLSTKAGSAASADLVGTVFPNAKWKFTAADASTIPAATTTPAMTPDITWTVSNGATYTSTGDGTTTDNEILVGAGTSTVTITAVVQNIAADATQDYVLDFTIDPASVLVDNGGIVDDYAEGQEPTANDGTNNNDGSGSGAFQNDAYQITINPAPNTTKIKFD